MASNLILAADIGFAATGMIVFAVERDGSGVVMDYACSRPKKDIKRKHLLVADSDVDRVVRMVRDILKMVRTHGITQIVAEIPSGGAKGARANRGMGMSTAMIATLVECQCMAPEWYTQGETREAAVGKPERLPKIPKTATKEEKKAIKRERTRAKKDIKDRVIAAMQNKYPKLKEIGVLADLEHIADAAATFEAAKNGNLVRVARTA